MNGKAVFPGGNAQSLDNIAGQPIAEYTHSKSGTVHKLEGPSKARNIIFKATGDYNDGDTWTLNNHPVTVTYNGGEELLPTAVLTGDAVQAVVMGDKLRLMLQKPTPQENILINGNLANPIIQRGLGEHTGSVHHIDMWSKDAAGIVKVDNTGLLMLDTDNHTNWAISQLVETLEIYKEQTVTLAVLAKSDDGSSFCIGVGDGGGYSNYAAANNNGTLLTFTWKVKTDRPHAFVIRRGGTGTLRPLKAKLEIGNRFTGWPTWDYGAELAKCQRYGLGLSGDIVRSILTGTSVIYFSIPAPVTLRTSPVLNPNNLKVRTVHGAEQTGFTLDHCVARKNVIWVCMRKESHGLTDAVLSSNGISFFSAEL